LALRPYREADASVAFAAMDQDEEVWRWDPGYKPNISKRKDNIARYTALRQQFGFGPCAAFLATEKGDEGEFIGQGGLNPYIYDHRDGSRTVEFEVMYKLSRSFWGRGYATEIAAFWVRFAFEQLRLPQLYICPNKANINSLAVLERLGARMEDDWLDDETVIGLIRNPSFKGPS